MRFSYLLPRLLIVAGVWAFFVFAFDPLLRWSMVAGGQAATGAKVDIGSLDTTFFPPSIELRGVAVANPAKPTTNVFEFDRTRFAIRGRPLLRRKLVVDEALVTGVAFGTQRQTSGKLPKTRSRSKGDPDRAAGLDRYFDAINDEASQLGTAWLDDLVDRIRLELDPNQLAAVRFVGALEEQWQGRIGAVEARVRGLEARLDAVKRLVENAPDDPFAKLQAFQRAAEEARALMAEAQAIRTDLTGLGTAARADFAKLDEVRRQDLETIRSKADLLKLDGGEITRSLVGPTVSRKLSQAGEWLEWAKRYASAFSTPRPQRLRGTDFAFPRPEDDLPGLLVRKLLVGGEFAFGERPLPFRAILTDVTDEPRRLDRPMRWKLLAEGDARIDVDGVFDRRPEVPIQDVTITFAYPRPVELAFGEAGDKLQVGVTAARTDWRARLRVEGDRVRGQVHFEQNPVTLVARAGEGVEEQIARVLAGSLANVDRLAVDVSIGGTFAEPEWSIESDIGDRVAGGLETFLAGELEARKAELIAKANALVLEKTGELQAKLDGRFREVVADLDLGELDAQKLIGRLAGGKLDRFGNILPIGMQNGLGGEAGSLPLPGGLGEKLGEQLDPRMIEERLGEQLDPAAIQQKLGEQLDPKKLTFDENPFDRFRKKKQ